MLNTLFTFLTSMSLAITIVALFTLYVNREYKYLPLYKTLTIATTISSVILVSFILMAKYKL